MGPFSLTCPSPARPCLLSRWTPPSHFLPPRPDGPLSQHLDGVSSEPRREAGSRGVTAEQRGSGPGTVRTSVLGAGSSLASCGEGTRAGGPLGPRLAGARGKWAGDHLSRLCQGGGPGLQKPRLQTMGSEGRTHPRHSPAGCPHPGSSHSSVGVLFGWVQPPGCIGGLGSQRAPAQPRVTFLAIGPPASCCVNPAPQLWVYPSTFMNFCIRACRVPCAGLSQDVGLSPCRVYPPPPARPACCLAGACQGSGGRDPWHTGSASTMGSMQPWLQRTQGHRSGAPA